MTRHRRAAIVMTVAVFAALLASSEELHRRLVAVIAFAEPTIVAHPVWGAVVFTALTALGAILVFVSSWLLVPIGVQAWGPVTCFVLLWVGWLLGGVVTYFRGALPRPPDGATTAPRAIITRYEGRIPSDGAISARPPGQPLGAIRHRRILLRLGPVPRAHLPRCVGHRRDSVWVRGGLPRRRLRPGAVHVAARGGRGVCPGADGGLAPEELGGLMNLPRPFLQPFPTFSRLSP